MPSRTVSPIGAYQAAELPGGCGHPPEIGGKSQRSFQLSQRDLSGDTLLPWLGRVVCNLDQTTHLKTV